MGRGGVRSRDEADADRERLTMEPVGSIDLNHGLGLSLGLVWSGRARSVGRSRDTNTLGTTTTVPRDQLISSQDRSANCSRGSINAWSRPRLASRSPNSRKKITLPYILPLRLATEIRCFTCSSTDMRVHNYATV